MTAPLFRKTYWNDPVAFTHDCIAWPEDEGPTPYQDEILGELPVRRRVSVRSPHGTGKTALSSWALLWFALTRDGADWKVPTTASAWRQLSKFLWPEIHKWARLLRWEKIGRGSFNDRSELLTLALSLSTGQAFALASDTPALIEGAHADYLLYIFDESKIIPDETWDAAEGAFASGEPFWLAVSTPGEPIGRFYDIHRRRPGLEDWWTRHITLDEAIAAGRVSEEWAAQRRRQWGADSAVFQNRVEGEFASSEEEGVIPLAWVELANERWHAWQDAEHEDELEFTCVGVDVARSGQDKTVLALRFGNVITELRRFSKQGTMETTGHVAGVLSRHGGYAVVDVIGIGAGVVDRLREQRFNVVPFSASEGTTAKDGSGELGFADMRSWAWWNMREMLNPDSNSSIALPPDDTLTGDLTAPHWSVRSGGRIKVESKDDVKKRLRRSTDDADATIQAFAQMESGHLADVPQPKARSKWVRDWPDEGRSKWRIG